MFRFRDSTQGNCLANHSIDILCYNTVMNIETKQNICLWVCSSSEVIFFRGCTVKSQWSSSSGVVRCGEWQQDSLDWTTMRSQDDSWGCKKRNRRNVEQEAVLKATAVRSPLPAGNVVDSSLSSLSSLWGVQQGKGGLAGGRGGQVGRGLGRGLGGGGGGRGNFIHPAIYCTTTWCFGLKGLRTVNYTSSSPCVVSRSRGQSSGDPVSNDETAILWKSKVVPQPLLYIMSVWLLGVGSVCCAHSSNRTQ